MNAIGDPYSLTLHAIVAADRLRCVSSPFFDQILHACMMFNSCEFSSFCLGTFQFAELFDVGGKQVTSAIFYGQELASMLLHS